jgi:hypothetical protein
MSDPCRICRGEVVALLDFGMQPFSNRFLHDPNVAEDRFLLALNACTRCGLVQLREPPTAAAMSPRFDWIRYNEPEGHLDAVATSLAALLGDRPQAAVLGLTYKDASLVERLRDRGYPRCSVLTPAELGATDPRAGIETIQASFTPVVAAGIRASRDPAEVVVARHVLEHAQNPLAFLSSLRTLLASGGILVLEVPDATRSLEGLDYATVWEEHAVSFTPPHLVQAIEAAGLHLVDLEIYPYPLEDSIVAVCSVDKAVPATNEARFFGTQVPTWDRPRALARRYGEGFVGRREAVRAALDVARSEGKRVGLFGAGHLAIKFVNLLGLESRITEVIDDHPAKKGMFLPGSRLPIVGSERLAASDGPLICLSSLSPESEERVLGRLGGFLERGGQFASIFPASTRAFLK